MRQLNAFQKIYRSQASLLKRKRVKKWALRRDYYNKREKILWKDLRMFQDSIYMKIYANRIRVLQKNIVKGIKDPIEQKKQKIFTRLKNIDLLIKIKHIITGLKDKYLQNYSKKQFKLSSQQILNWLKSYFKIEKELQYLKYSSKKVKKEVYHAISILSKQKQILIDKKSESAEQWYKKFIKQCKPFISQQINLQNIHPFDDIQVKIKQQNKNIEEENSIELFNNNSQVPQVNQKLKQLPRRGRLIHNMMLKLQNELEQNKHKKLIRRYDFNQQIKVLRVKKPRCPVLSCKKQLTVRRCPDSNHLITICQQCLWNQHNCEHIQSQYQSLQSIDIIAKGEKIKNFDIARLKKSESQNNLMQVLEKFKYRYTDKMKIIPSLKQKIICHYPVLGSSACNQILRNRQQQRYLPLTIKESSVIGAGLGVFATVGIKKVGTLICSYLGQVGLGSKTPILRSFESQQKINDSIFTLGWIQKQLLLIAPNLYSNIGRFINYNESNFCNLKPSLCLLEVDKNKYEIAVFLTTTRQIVKGEELFYNYGNEYSFQQ